MIDAAVAELEPLLGVTAACVLSGKSRATLHRQRNPAAGAAGAPARRRRPAHPAALTCSERDQVLAALRSDRFCDKSPAQVWATLLDEGVYLCSISTI